MREKSRILTLEQIRRKHACANGREIFRRLWGTRASVNQEWARQVAPHLDWYDANWCARRLLPGWAAVIYVKISNQYCCRNYSAYSLICWSIFAALYVECCDA